MADNSNRRFDGAGAYVVRVLKFGLVGTSGLVLNTALLGLFSGVLGIHYLIGAGLATQGSTAWNFAFTELWVFRDRNAVRRIWRRFWYFWTLNNSALLIRWPLLWLLIDVVGIQYLVANVITLVVVMAGRYVVSEFWIWGGENRSEAELVWR